MFHGLHWIGIELEQKFVNLGSGYDCDGQVEWKEKTIYSFGGWYIRLRAEAKYWGRTTECWNGDIEGIGYADRESAEKRLDIILQQDQRWPKQAYSIFCEQEGERVIKELVKPALCGKRESHAPHHVEGNIELWNRRYGNGMLPRWGTAVILQGDSRQLVDVLGKAEGVIASPPFVNSIESRGDGIDWEKACKRGYRSAGRGAIADGYGTDPRNLGNMREGDVDAVVKACISSPPWAEGHERCGGPMPKYFKEKLATKGRKSQGYQNQGNTPGQLAAMPVAVVSSPPYQTGGHHQHQMDAWNTNKGGQGFTTENHGYGNSPGQLQGQGDTFWGAARQIVEQCYQILVPGGVAIFVTKRFVRDKKIVEFSQQWAAMCEACGFELIEWIKAWLIEDKGMQYTLDGGIKKREIKRASFFRRLYESKYPENSIDWEDVLIFRK